MVQPAVYAEVMLVKDDKQAYRELEDLGHDYGRRRHEHVASPRPHVAHNENEQCILGRQQEQAEVLEHEWRL